jgi:hypothetical protein
VEVVVQLPAVVSGVISLPLDQILDAMVPDVAVKDRLNVILSFAINEDRIGGRNGVMAFEWFVQCKSQLDDGEYRAETAHGVGQGEAISIVTNTSFDLVRTELAIHKLG